MRILLGLASSRDVVRPPNLSTARLSLSHVRSRGPAFLFLWGALPCARIDEQSTPNPLPDLRPRESFFQAVQAPVPELMSYRCAVVGDNQNGPNVFAAICQRIATERVDLFVGLGDHIQNGGQIPSEWVTQWAIPLAPIAQIPRLGARGNHDDPAGYAMHVWPIPMQQGIGQWTALTLGSVRWVILDSNQETYDLRISLAPGGIQRRWLEAEVSSQEWRQATWRIAIWHHPHKTELWDGGCYYPTIRDLEDCVSVLSLAGVSLFLAGHSHSFQRGNMLGATWIVSGGGGGHLDTRYCWAWPEITVAQPIHHYLLLAISPSSLTLTAHRTDGTEFDRTVIGRRP